MSYHNPFKKSCRTPPATPTWREPRIYQLCHALGELQRTEASYDVWVLPMGTDTIYIKPVLPSSCIAENVVQSDGLKGCAHMCALGGDGGNWEGWSGRGICQARP